MIEKNQTRLHEVFEQAAKLPAPERRAYLDEACAGDAELRDRVEQLLAWDTQAGEFLEKGPIKPTTPGEHAGECIGPYTLERVIGEGGMAVVWLARQSEPVSRFVAIKILKPGMDTRSILARFEMERHVLAHLNHPHVASVLDAGLSSKGRPFFVMEYVEGETFTRFCDSHALETKDKLQLFIQVCKAVSHAHQKGVIHRDLKPSNILVTTQGGAPEPKVIDFGIAKATAGDLAGATMTEQGQLIGTPEYMSPEQCVADPDGIDVRTDVYSLGVLLYEVLCGRLPYDLEGVPLYEAPRVIREQTVVRPTSIDRRLGGDLETIVLKALEKRREDRYQSAADFRRDIERFLNQLPIEARPRSMAYHVRMFSRRHRTLVGAVAAVFLTLVIGVVVSVVFATDAHQEAIRRGDAEFQATRERDEAVYRSYVASMAAAEAAFRSSQYQRLQTHLEAAPVRHRGWEWDFLNEQANASELLLAHEAMVDCVTLHPGGAFVLSGARDGMIRWWRTSDGGLERSVKSHAAQILSISFSDDGRVMATGGDDGLVNIWNGETGALDRTIDGHRSSVTDVIVSADGSRVYTSSADATVCCWLVATGQQVWRTPHERDVQTAALSEDGWYVASGDEGGVVRIIDAEDGSVLHRVQAHDELIRSVGFSPDGRRLVTSAQVREIAIWDTESMSRLATSDVGQWGAVYSPDGSRIAVGDASPSFALRIIDGETGELLGSLPGHGDTAASLAFGNDGSTLYSASWDRTVRRWDVASSADPCVYAPAEVVDTDFSPDGRLIAAAVDSGPVLLSDASTRQVLRSIELPGRASRAVAFSPNGRWLAIGWRSGGVDLWDARTGELHRAIGEHPDLVTSLAFSPDGERLASGSRDGYVHVWDVGGGSSEPLHRLDGGGRVYAVDYGAADRIAVVNSNADGLVRLYDGERGELVSVLTGHDSRVYAAAFSPNGRWLATGSRDQTVRLWDAVTGDSGPVIAGHGEFVTDLAFSPNGDRLAGASFFRTLTLWDGSTFEMMLNLDAHEAAIPTVSFSPDGRRIATGSMDGTLRVWDSRTLSLQRRERRALADRAASDNLEVRRLIELTGSKEAAAAAIEAGDHDPLERHGLLNALLRLQD